MGRYSYLDCLFRYHSRDGPPRAKLAMACEGCCLEAHLAARGRYPRRAANRYRIPFVWSERAERNRESDAIHLQIEQ